MNIDGVRLRIDVIDGEGEQESEYGVLVIEDDWAALGGLGDMLVIRHGDVSYGLPLADFEQALELARAVRSHEAARLSTEATP